MSESGQSSEDGQKVNVQQTDIKQQQGKPALSVPLVDFYQADPTGKRFVAQTQRNPHVLPVPEGEELARLLEEERQAHPGQGEADLLKSVTDRLYNREAVRLGNAQLAQRAQKRGLPVPQPKTQEPSTVPEEQLPKPTLEDALKLLGPHQDANEE